MSWTLTGWAKGASRQGEPQAVRMQITRPDFDLNELTGMQAEASGYYRREYGTWAAEIGAHAEAPGEERKVIHGRKLQEHDAQGADYQGPPDEVVTSG